MYIPIAVLLILHGFAHLVGFVVPWKLMTLEEMPYTTRILDGRINAGSLGIRIIGVLWLLAAQAFLVAGIGLLLHWSLWLPYTLIVTVISILLSIVGWPDSKIGLLVNAGIFVILRFLPDLF